jgi:hypothetical protein
MNGFVRSVTTRLRQPSWLVITSFIAACCLAGLVTLAMGVPVPRVHDEFAYLLGADTYASGRLVNPQHSHWQHFESFHVLSSPVYLPKYPPGQSLVLAAGKLLGHPQIGVCLSTGFAAASLAWMLAGWLPSRFVCLSWLVAVLHPGLLIKWSHSYMGGALAMTGACLLLGALARTRRKPSVKLSVIAALGILILANTRPFEGLVLTVSVGIGLIFILVRSGKVRPARFIVQIALPSGLVLACGGSLMMLNNYWVTGSILRLPYQLYEAQYGLTPLLHGQKRPEQTPNYRHWVMRKYYEDEEAQILAKYSTAASFLREKTNSLASLTHFFGGGTQYLMLLGLPLALRWSRYRLAILVLVPSLFAAVATPWTLTHYAAPAAPLIIFIVIASFTELARLLGTARTVDKESTRTDEETKNTRSKTTNVLLASLAFVLMLLHGFTLCKNELRANGTPWVLRRDQIQQELSQQSKQFLIFVQYSAEHNPHEEWVYNLSDIDRSPVVWARQLSPEADKQLIAYFAEREVLYLNAQSGKTSNHSEGS